MSNFLMGAESDETGDDGRAIPEEEVDALQVDREGGPRLFDD